MACGSSCCGPGDVPVAARPPADDTCFGPNVSEQGAGSPEEHAEDGCLDACCDGSDTKALDGVVDCGVSEPVDEDCQQGCCGSDTVLDEVAAGGCQQGCCAQPKGSSSHDKDKASRPRASTSRDVSGTSYAQVKASKDCEPTKVSCCEAKAEREAPCTKSADNASKECCSSPAASKSVDRNSSCCGDKATPSALEPAESDCNKGCCSEPSAPKTEDPNNPSCCEGKTSPCCDVSWIDRIALRDCEVSSGMSSRNTRVIL